MAMLDGAFSMAVSPTLHCKSLSHDAVPDKKNLHPQLSCMAMAMRPDHAGLTSHTALCPVSICYGSTMQLFRGRPMLSRLLLQLHRLQASALSIVFHSMEHYTSTARRRV